MKILIATTHVPFISGGAEIQALSLKTHLEKAGHTCEIFSLPFRGEASDIVHTVPYAKRLDLNTVFGHRVDRIIGLKFPAYLLPHSSKAIWLIHQQRDVYDLWDSGHSSLLNHPSGQAIREMIGHLDQQAFQECKLLVTESQNVSKRLQKYNGISASPLYHPPMNEEKFYTAEAQPYFFFPSRLNPLKRQELVLKALARTRNPVQVTFAGVSDIPQYEGQIRERVEELHLQDRVKMLGRISEDQKLDLYAKCQAVIYPPYDEDYGYVTLEAMLSSKSVITCHDSGGTLEFVQPGKTGWVCYSTPEELAGTLDQAWEQTALAKTYGAAGRDLYQSMDISWKRVVATLCE
jgi:glycosyltransferase involved in cell wall biosynthesis